MQILGTLNTKYLKKLSTNNKIIVLPAKITGFGSDYPKIHDSNEKHAKIYI